jgi:hypothetical protein
MIETIKSINKITFESGAYWISSHYTGNYIIEIDKKGLIGKYTYKSYFYNTEIKWKISRKYYMKFIDELICMNIFSWNNKYSDENVCDGGYWSLKIEYNKNELLEIDGSNAYPNDYDMFFSILMKYFPIIQKDNEYRLKIERKKW